ncbi:MAG: hypothetical protein NTV52_01585 [Acidobacteria bacterium]|nr:hypothetical protein [Acidobacteriota bacterium]
MAQFDNDPKKIAETVRATLAATPGNVEFNTRWKWSEATKRPDGATIIPDGKRNAPLVVHTSAGTFFDACLNLRAAACSEITAAPGSRSIHVKAPNSGQKPNFALEGKLVHETSHSDKGYGEYRAIRQEQKYLASVGRRDWNHTPELTLLYVAFDYPGKTYGSAVREYLNEQTQGRLTSEAFEKWIDPRSPFILNIVATRVANLKAEVDPLIGSSSPVAMGYATVRTREMTDIVRALSKPHESQWMLDVIRGLTEGGSVPLALAPEEQKFFQSLVKAARTPTSTTQKIPSPLK